MFIDSISKQLPERLVHVSLGNGSKGTCNLFDGMAQLLHKAEVRFIKVPDFDELSVRALWKEGKDDGDLNRYFPDDPKGLKLPPREFFFNVLNTV